MKPHALFALTTLACGLACGGEGDDRNNAFMAPGQNCMACHKAGGAAQEAPFSVAGTVFASATADPGTGLAGVLVILTDANDVETTLVSNAAGNFFTGAALALPLKKTAVLRNGQRTEMASAPEGACNRCHTQPPTGEASGRIHVP